MDFLELTFTLPQYPNAPKVASELPLCTSKNEILLITGAETVDCQLNTRLSGKYTYC